MQIFSLGQSTILSKDLDFEIFCIELVIRSINFSLSVRGRNYDTQIPPEEKLECAMNDFLH